VSGRRECSCGAYLGAYLGNRLARQRQPFELVIRDGECLRGSSMVLTAATFRLFASG
jgi:hypothetical protein